ncbi:MAG TPA: 2OG-Fe(II) oxygenase [Allosphingosinicella sp.]|nr:2OG-Fe(II) oxygenase [Allosphingosinicella sp.]
MERRGAASPLRLKEGLIVLGRDAAEDEGQGAESREGRAEEVFLGSHFEDSSFKVEPYRFVTASCTKRARLRDLRAGLAAATFWQKRSDTFFRHSEARLFSHNSEGFGWLVTEPCLRSVQRFVEDCFGVPLAPEMQVVAHRMAPGDYSGFHNDSPRLGWETHRLNLYLNDDWETECGGRLQIASTMSGEDVSGYIEPRMGGVMAFEACPDSYHAIEPVRQGERYSILYLLWHAANAPTVARAVDSLVRDARSAWERAVVESFEPLIELLHASGASELPHGESNLMDHLLDTCCLLRAWGMPEHVGLAGLLQGIDEEYLAVGTLASLGLKSAPYARAVALLAGSGAGRDQDLESERAALKLANIVAATPHVTFSHARWAARKREWNGAADLRCEPARQAARLLFDHGAEDGGPLRPTRSNGTAPSV